MQTRQKKCMCVQQSRKLVPREHINKCFCFLMKISRSTRRQFHPQPSSVLNELGDKEEGKEGTDAVTSFGLSSSIYIQPKSCSFLGGSTCVFFICGGEGDVIVSWSNKAFLLESCWVLNCSVPSCEDKRDIYSDHEFILCVRTVCRHHMTSRPRFKKGKKKEEKKKAYNAHLRHLPVLGLRRHSFNPTVD